MAEASRARPFSGVIMSREPRTTSVGQETIASRVGHRLEGVAGGKIVLDRTPGFARSSRSSLAPVIQRPAIAAAETGVIAVAPQIDHVDGVVMIGRGCAEQVLRHGHGERGADEAERADPVGMARGKRNGGNDAPIEWPTMAACFTPR